MAVHPHQEIIVISSDSSSDLESTNGSSSFDSSSDNNYEEIVYSSPNIVSSKGLSKSLLKWYDDLIDEDIEEFMFSISKGKKTKDSMSSTSKAKPSFSSVAKAEASLLAKASGSSFSKAKASSIKVKRSAQSANVENAWKVNFNKLANEEVLISEESTIKQNLHLGRTDELVNTLYSLDFLYRSVWICSILVPAAALVLHEQPSSFDIMQFLSPVVSALVLVKEHVLVFEHGSYNLLV
ncbi:hypothetical protein Tco_1105677 [Tanacetum coccineum]